MSSLALPLPTARRLPLLALAASLGCHTTTEPHPHPLPSATPSTSSRPTPPPAPPRFFALGPRACLGAPSHPASCGQPSEQPGDAGPATSLPLRPIPGTATLVEAATRDDCFLTADAVAFCHGREVARAVRSVAAAPYLLREDGTVLVIRAATDPDPIHALRASAAARLPLLDRLVATDLATCGLARTGEVWCWPEPAYPYDLSLQTPIEPHPAPVPGLADAVEIALMPWLTLCARTRAGAVLCSAAPARATEVCVLQGRSDLRCGPTTNAPPVRRTSPARATIRAARWRGRWCASRASTAPRRSTPMRGSFTWTASLRAACT